MNEKELQGYGKYIPEPKLSEILSEGFSYPKYVYSVLSAVESGEDLNRLYEQSHKNSLDEIEKKYRNEIRTIQIKYDNDRLRNQLKEDVYTEAMIKIAKKYQKELEKDSNHKTI